jgi:hypothetical protein
MLISYEILSLDAGLSENSRVVSLDCIAHVRPCGGQSKSALSKRSDVYSIEQDLIIPHFTSQLSSPTEPDDSDTRILRTALKIQDLKQRRLARTVVKSVPGNKSKDFLLIYVEHARHRSIRENLTREADLHKSLNLHGRTTWNGCALQVFVSC